MTTAGGSHSFTVEQGSYTYFCNNSLCGSGHTQMEGSFDVGTSTPNPGRGY